jgi:hypothetical protein
MAASSSLSHDSSIKLNHFNNHFGEIEKQPLFKKKLVDEKKHVILEMARKQQQLLLGYGG